MSAFACEFTRRTAPNVVGTRRPKSSQPAELTQFLAVTPDVQLIVDPALNPSEDVLALFGFRLRVAF